jgi:hypothetical protein
VRIPNGRYTVTAAVDTGPLAGKLTGSQEAVLNDLVAPAKPVGEAKRRPTEIPGVTVLDIAAIFTRPHNSLEVGGGDNASFKTWFDQDNVMADDVPFLVQRTGNDVVVSTNNTENVYELRSIDAPAGKVHFLIWGYNYPRKPAQLRLTFTDGSSSLYELPLTEWTQPKGVPAFAFKNTVSGFSHAAVFHETIALSDKGKTIKSIESLGEQYGLVAIALDNRDD